MDDELFEAFLASLKFVTEQQVAIGQLQTAIWLWFHEEDKYVVSDPGSVHTLAVAAMELWPQSAGINTPNFRRWQK